MAEGRQADAEQQIKREERKIVEETERAGGHVHEFNPDASPEQKAAALRKVHPFPQSAPFVQLHVADMCDIEHAPRLGFEESRSRDCIGHRHGIIIPPLAP